MRDISNFGNNLRDEIIEYRLEHETGHTLKIKFVDHGDKTNAQIYLYSKTGEFLSKTKEFPFDQTGQRAVDRVELIRGSSEGHEAEYEIKVLFRGGKDPVYCPVDDILATLRKELSNKITIDLDNSREDESSVITSKIYNTSGEELSEDHISLDGVKMTAQNISMIADAESEEAEPTPVFVADVNDKKVTVHDLDVDNSINISKAKINALEVTGVTGDIKLGTKRAEEGVEPALVVNTTDQIVTVGVGHILKAKGSADFENAVSVAETLTVGSTAAFSGDASVKGTLRATNLAAANSTLSVNDSSVSIIGNTRINGDITLLNSEREVSLTEDDFKINLMGESETSVTNKKYVDKYVDDYMSGAKLASGISITADGQLKIGDAVLNEATLTKLIALAESMTETKEK